jgi:hypothetical protein
MGDSADMKSDMKSALRISEFLQALFRPFRRYATQTSEPKKTAEE